MGDNKWAGLRSLNGLDFVNPPLNLTFYNYNSQCAFLHKRILHLYSHIILFVEYYNLNNTYLVQKI